MINVILRIEQGYNSFVTLDVFKDNNPNSDEKLIQKVCNVLVHKIPFTDVQKDIKTLLRKDQLDRHEYDHVINMIKNIKSRKKLNLHKYLRNGIIVKNRIKIIFDPKQKNISAELKEFLDEKSTLNFIGWFTKFEHVYNFEFKNYTLFKEFLYQLKRLDITEFTTEKLIKSF